MKKILAVILCVVMTFSLIACGKNASNATTKSGEGESVDAVEEQDNTVDKASDEDEKGLIPIRTYSYYDESKDKNGEYTGGVWWDVPRVGGDLAEKYQKLDEALNSRYKEVLSISEEFMKQVYESEYDEPFSVKFTSDAHVLRSDTSVVSVVYENYEYNGGAHGYHTFVPVNYNPSTGEKILYSDIVKDKQAFANLVDAKIKQDYSDLYNELRDIKEYFNDSTDDEICISIGNDGITVYFNIYVLGAYAYGWQRATIPYSELNGMIDDNLMPFSKSYISPITEMDDYVAVDVNGDGAVERFDIEEMYDDDIYGCKVTGQGKMVEVYNYCYGSDNYLVCDNGTYYIYFFEQSENDWLVFSALRLNDMYYNSDKHMDFNSEGISADDGNFLTGYHEELIDPANMTLYYRTDVLGTNTAHSRYKIGEDGFPVMIDKAYVSDTARALQFITDLEVEELDSDGTVTGKTTLKKGTFVTIAYTDDETYADIVVVDQANLHKMEEVDFNIYLLNDVASTYATGATLYRVSYDKNDYPHLVNGKSEDEVFDFVMYAG